LIALLFVVAFALLVIFWRFGRLRIQSRWRTINVNGLERHQ